MPARKSRVLPVLLLALSFAGFAYAHSVGLSRGEYCLKDGSLQAALVFSRTELAQVDASLDANHDGDITDAEIATGRGKLEKAIASRIAVIAGTACTPAVESIDPEEQDGVRLRLRWSCADPGATASVEMAVLDDLPFGHRHIAQVVSGTSSTVQLAFRSNRSFAVAPSARPCESTHADGEADASFLGFLEFGIEHIFTGYDHLVFLLGLILVGGRLKSLLGVVTAFTIGHSITLALAALDILTPGTWLVEPAIALSIAYVGIENFFVRDAHKRWRITLPFGLIHGFGFAGVLRERGLPQGQVASALVAFNLGVEAGQVAILVVALPLLMWTRKQPWFGDRGLKIVSGAIVAAGIYWFVQRVSGLG